MAKQRRENDFIDEQPVPAPAQAGLVELPAIDPEKEAMRQRLVELEGILQRMADEASRREQTESALAALDEPTAQKEPAAMRYWRVELENALTHVVRARDKANAWEQYKRELGIIGSQFEPQVSPSGRDEYHRAQARRHNCRPEEYPLPDD